MTEENLSDKIVSGKDARRVSNPFGYIWKEDIREFIRQLKIASVKEIGDYRISWIIDKLAGKELSGDFK